MTETTHPPAELRVGAARVEITPSLDDLPARMLGVNDPVFVRAIVLDDGTRRAAFVSVDLIGLTDDVWRLVSQRVHDQHAISDDYLLLSATHTHSVPDELGAGFVDAIVEAVGLASTSLRPATLATGAGRCHINVNRNLFDPATHEWREGRNDDGPSDKTVTVLRFSDADDLPIAVLYHYAVHPVVTGMLDLLSADIPGAAGDHIETALGHGAVALWSSGCAGDQNPIFYQQTFDLRAIRIRDAARRGVDLANSMPAGGEGLDRGDAEVVRLMDEQRAVTRALGVMLGEEVLQVVRDRCGRPRASTQLSALHRDVPVPGRRRTDTGRAGRPGSYVDADPVPLRVGLLRIGDVVVGSVDAELFTEIGLRFRRESPAKVSLLSTLTNGRARSGYVASNAAGGFHTFEVLSSSLQPGHAESLIVTTLVDLVEATA